MKEVVKTCFTLYFKTYETKQLYMFNHFQIAKLISPLQWSVMTQDNLVLMLIFKSPKQSYNV